MKYTAIVLIISFLFSAQSFSQDTSAYPKPKLFLELAVLDLPYLNHASQAFANHRQQQGMSCGCSKNLGDHIRAYSSPSMNQSLQMSKNLTNSVCYFIEKGSQALFKPHQSKGRKTLSRISSEVASIISSGYLMLAPFGQVWLHEEFHRNIMSRRGIYSVDEYWKFKGGDYIKVSNVLDEDLVDFKFNFPQEHIRMSAAGIEGEVLLARKYQADNFFKNLNTPISGPYLFGVLGAIGYIYTTKDWVDINETLHKMNAEETSILSRDFSGHDIATWTYDLFNPFEPFQNRGPHPSGNGIRRYINPVEDFTPAMTEYVDKMSRRSALNLLSPSVIGIRKIKINEDLFVNFAMRHILTSFGDDRQADLLVKNKWGNFVASYHKYSNNIRNFTGVELQMVDKIINILGKDVDLDSRLMYWNQPENLLFRDSTGRSGGALEFRLAPRLNKWYQPYVEVEGKTQGWLAGNPYHNSNLSVRFGFKALLQ